MSANTLLIRNGTVLDGSGAPPFRADVLIAGERIADVILPGQAAPADCETLDAAGLTVAPGFIDIHSHSDFTLLVDPRAVSSIAQGVTLEVVGNCGHGCAPIANPAHATGNIYGYRADYELNWRTMGEYLARLEAARPALNVATLTPNGNLRLAVAGLVDRPSSPDEIARMQRLLAQSMEEGAFGYSTGLEYGPERACSEDEIAALARVAAERGGFYATHTRNRSDAGWASVGAPPAQQSPLGIAGTLHPAQETIAEAIRASAQSGAPLQISHISVVSRLAEDGRWAVEQALAQVDAARARGLDVRFDMHTRLFGTTHLSAALPPDVLAGTPGEIARRLAEPGTRRRVKEYRSIISALARGDWSRIVLFDPRPGSPNAAYARRSLAEIAAARDMEPLDAVCDILQADPENLHEYMIIAFAYSEADIRPAFAHPLCMVGSDATALATDGPLAGASFHGAFTWAAWFYRHFVRETRQFTPQEAIRRVTSLPAARLGLTDRGIVRPGAHADLALFDPEAFAERGTTFEPNRTATGMRHVFVNGTAVWRDGAPTGERAGKVLRKR